MKLLLKSSLILLVLVMTPVSSIFANEAEDIKALKVAVAKRIPSAVNATVKPTPVTGLYEVIVGGEILYMTKDARYILSGDMHDMQSRQNLTEGAKGGIRLSSLKELGEENMLVYTPKGEVKHTITVFTDIYCPYCVRLHSEMDDYLDNGVKVRYIFVPFKGEKSVNASISVWCSEDKNKAMDVAKSGGAVEQKTCDNPISRHQALASQLGIRGTPAIMMESGKLMPGYVPSTKLIPQL